MKNILTEKIKNRSLRIGVIGLGYVGLPLAVEKAAAGFRTIGFDVQQSKIDMVNRGENYIGDVVAGQLAEVVQDGMLKATADFSFIRDVDFIAICVPTPLDKYKQPDISYVKSSAEEIARHMTKDTIVVLESTTYPGTTEELILPILESHGLKCGKDFYLGFSPERVDPGNLVYKTKNTPKVVGGVGKDATEVIAAVYREVLQSDVLEVSSPKVAEMEKILENTYRNINIGLANEMAIICDRMGINVWEVIDAAKTKPYGFQAFYPGAGLGGHCIPLDPFYLSWKAREYDYHMRLIEISGEINTYMPEYVVERCSRILNNDKKALNGSKVLIIGVAYKADIDDYRESPAIPVIRHLIGHKAEVSYYDPHISAFASEEISMQSIDTIDSVSGYDIAIIVTAHTGIDYEGLAGAGIPIFDCKNAMKNVKNRKMVEVL